MNHRRPKALSTTRSTCFLFLDQFFLIVIASCRPEPVPTSTDVAAQHTREGAFPPSTILVAPPERQQPSPNDTVSPAPELPPKDQLPDFHLTLLMCRHLLSHRLSTIAIQPQLNSQCNCLPESEYLKSRFAKFDLGPHEVCPSFLYRTMSLTAAPYLCSICLLHTWPCLLVHSADTPARCFEDGDSGDNDGSSGANGL